MQGRLIATPRKLPLFVFPQNMTFFLSDQSTHKQILTVYNPYDFPITFKVLCTAPDKYKVVPPEGTIKSLCCVDIVVRHTSLVMSNCNVIDKFKIRIQDYPNKQIIGRKDVKAQLLPGTRETSQGTRETAGRSTPMFEQLPVNEETEQQSFALIGQNEAIDKWVPKSRKLQHNLFHENIPDKNTKMYLPSNIKSTMDKGEINYVALFAGIICIAGLLLPTEGEQNNRVPDYLHISSSFKLIFSFVLGMVTSIILRL
ncbi:Motile sperm domain-containing protein 1 [Habropoda laboriosa]|uniref:Motile sperm domain-containing protein 1 n=1 Tax=Habropoda laboriosa TaxID=597456 RepID=A0A0L7RGY0_9HYME|nr:PREDICTED: motile sperm domain-containing protein 1-like [Habropoda laboriosa]KOC69946.1 Motile sperm domain-containing protein 1 [Habropoda laboriosa]